MTEQSQTLLDPEALAPFLDERGLGEGELDAERIGEGHSNVTFLIKRGGERFVLRRPPRPPLPPSPTMCCVRRGCCPPSRARRSGCRG